MSRAADPYNNALMESCIGTLNTKCTDHVFPARQVARSEVFRYLESWTTGVGCIRRWVIATLSSLNSNFIRTTFLSTPRSKAQ